MLTIRTSKRTIIRSRPQLFFFGFIIQKAGSSAIRKLTGRFRIRRDLPAIGNSQMEFQCPNVHIRQGVEEFAEALQAAVLAELGRQPYSAHDFLLKYQHRVLMGKDIYDVNEYKWYFRAWKPATNTSSTTASAALSGESIASFPDEVLKKIYLQKYAETLRHRRKGLPGLGFRLHLPGCITRLLRN
jgi:hypothetical protein